MSTSSTKYLIDNSTPSEWGIGLSIGQDAARGGNKHAKGQLKHAWLELAAMRELWGFKGVKAPLLSAPENQHKLGLGTVPSYGFTGHSKLFKSRSFGQVFDSCTASGWCVKVCVLKNGNGGYSAVQRAWGWRQDFLLRCPFYFAIVIGYELERAVMKHGKILMRPDVNTDLQWHKFARALVDGSVFGDTIKFYGYTKHASILDGDGWITPHYRVSYSLNENSDHEVVNEFLERGGSVAAVTDRYYTSRTRQGIEQWAGVTPVVDADQSDEWMFESRVIGDLAFKPRTSALRAAGQDSAFVHKVYGTAGRMATKADADLAADVAVMLTVKPGR